MVICAVEEEKGEREREEQAEWKKVITSFQPKEEAMEEGCLSSNYPRWLE
jgi:hypothetical protein